MKKNILFPLSIFFIMVLLLTASCGGEDVSVDFLTNADNIYINTNHEMVCSFNLTLISKHKIKSVEYIGLECEEEKGTIDANITDITTDELIDYKYNGYYTRIIMIDITSQTKEKPLKINKVVLKIDDDIKKIDIGHVAKHEFCGGNVFNDSLQISVVPNEFSSKYINSGKSVVYKFTATKDIELKGVRFKDFLKAENIMCSVDKSDMITAKFPISVKEGQSLEVSLCFSSDVANEMSYLMTNIFFDFVVAESGEEMSNCAVVVFDPIYPISDNDLSGVNKLIEQSLK